MPLCSPQQTRLVQGNTRRRWLVSFIFFYIQSYIHSPETQSHNPQGEERYRITVRVGEGGSRELMTGGCSRLRRTTQSGVLAVTRSRRVPINGCWCKLRRIVRKGYQWTSGSWSWQGTFSENHWCYILAVFQSFAQLENQLFRVSIPLLTEKPLDHRSSLSLNTVIEWWRRFHLPLGSNDTIPLLLEHERTWNQLKHSGVCLNGWNKGDTDDLKISNSHPFKV